MRSAGVRGVRRRSPHARGAAHKNCRQRRYASELPPSTYSKSWKVGFARRCEARARARCARWADGGAGSDARLPLRETRRVQGLRNGSSAKASVAALGAAHGVERPPPRGRARGRAVVLGRAGGGSVSGRRAAQAAPRRSRAPGAAGRQRSTSRRASSAPKPYPLLAAGQPGSRNESGLRQERQSLTGKVEESAGRRSAQAAPRRSRASAQRGGGGRRLIAPQRTAHPLPSRSRLSAATNQIRGRNCNH